MTYLFTTKAGWRKDSSRFTSRQEVNAGISRLAAVLDKPRQADVTALKAEKQRGPQERLLRKLRAISVKRPPRAGRRSNPKSLASVEAQMRDLCLATAAQRNLDMSKACWFRKAEIASLLKVPEHFVEQVVHLWNRQGACSEGHNDGVHDTHRARSWGEVWTSSWQDTLYTLKLEKLAALP